MLRYLNIINCYFFAIAVTKNRDLLRIGLNRLSEDTNQQC